MHRPSFVVSPRFSPAPVPVPAASAAGRPAPSQARWASLGARLAPLGLALGLAGLAAFASGCQPHIGDHCNLNTDCSLQGNRVCDNAEPNGYCTSFNCSPNTCPDNAVCVMLYPAVPGCPYNGYGAPSRTNRTLCLKSCGQNSDCRTGEGYECKDPTTSPWDAVIVDDNQNQKVCLATPTALDSGASVDAEADGVAPVCMPQWPGVSPIDGGATVALDASGGD